MDWDRLGWTGTPAYTGIHLAQDWHALGAGSEHTGTQQDQNWGTGIIMGPTGYAGIRLRVTGIILVETGTLLGQVDVTGYDYEYADSNWDIRQETLRDHHDELSMPKRMYQEELITIGSEDE
ncbi:hypothetical protein DUI87_13750 [Hirundo rustica rustica]|uniref:Uncharacterized protein n=1 Tax=Hirundo rustica rustica TaxID=333673 RepID=A0A3M0K8A3_HIRRU|nr:hypothetical protein DUI87_13750 [Hirundo rustica rustica]